MPTADDVADIKAVIAELKATYRKDEVDLFTAWILHMVATDDEKSAVEAVVNRKNERNVDGVFIDDREDLVTITQTKYKIRSLANRPSGEPRNDVVGFADVAGACLGSDEDFVRLFPDDPQRTDPTVRQSMKDARRAVAEKGYGLHLVYATLGTVSRGIREDAEDAMKSYPEASLDILTWRDVLLMIEDYVEWGIGPLVREITIPVEGRALLTGPDADPRIESWVFTVSAGSLADVYKQPKNRLFARNIRAPLGVTSVNKAIKKTLRSEPERFWYFNNGITLVCDHVDEIRRRGETESLVLRNPQIINGQQTTVSIAEESRGRQKASLVARVIRVPRDSRDDRDRFNALVSNIVAATNWQNQISSADLRSTDPIQVEIARRLYRREYLYIRKKGQQVDTRNVPGNRRIKKEGMAKAIADCTLGPAYSLLHGESALFSPEEKHYERIFRDRGTDLLLTCYWMQQNVAKSARGHEAEWAKARLLVQYFLWQELDGLTGYRRAFREQSELWSPARSEFTETFLRLTAHPFRTAASSYRANAGRGSARIEPTAYFKGYEISGGIKVSSAYPAFEEMWTARKNAGRRSRFAADKEELLDLLEAE